ncbi:MAG: hypothetical protein ABI199_09840 [Bacteroidia bacterium]
MRKIFFWTLIFSSLCNATFAQKGADSLNYNIISHSEFIPTITNAKKINDSPALNDSVPPIPKLHYGILQRQIPTSFSVAPIMPANMVGEPLTKLYSSILTLGLGTYTTPYGEYFFHNLRSKDYAIGIHLKHLSSSGDLSNSGYSAYSDNVAEVYGQYFFAHETVSGQLDYNRNVVHQYGYDVAQFENVTNNDTKQRFQKLGAEFGFESHLKDSSSVNHNIQLNYYNLMDLFHTTENEAGVNVSFFSFLKQQNVKVEVNAKINYYGDKSDSATTNHTIVNFSPQLITVGHPWTLALGMTGAADFTNQNQFYAYPKVCFDYDIYEHIIIPYAGADGNLQRNNFLSFSQENPFISSTIDMQNTDTKLRLYGGLKGNISSNISYNARVSQSKINNMPFFVTDVTSPYFNTFNAVYDNVTVLNVHGELEYQHSEKLRLFFKADYNKYSMTNELEPWYMPQIQFNVAANYNIQDKIVVKLDVFYIGQQYAMSYFPSPFAQTYSISAKTLKGITDFNVGLEYRYTKRMSAFVNFNNIANIRYYRWDNYPMQRFNVMVGISYVF